jgi:hypothetical protein
MQARSDTPGIRPAKKVKPDARRRFIEAAKAHEADESGEAFERAFGAIAPPKRPKARTAPKRRATKVKRPQN